MQYIEEYIEQLKRRLSELDPHLILLFGSHASGTPDEYSDIDLIVVTKDEFIPVDFNARVDLQLRISEHIFDIAKKVPVDLFCILFQCIKNYLSKIMVLLMMSKPKEKLFMKPQVKQWLDYAFRKLILFIRYPDIRLI